MPARLALATCAWNTEADVIAGKADRASRHGNDALVEPQNLERAT
jgi:hypothetical protein